MLDTSFLVAFHYKRDSQHLLAQRKMSEFLTLRWGTGLLLEYVVLETLTVLMIRDGLQLALEAKSFLCYSSQFDFSCSDLYDATLNYFSHQTTRLSFTDCALAITALSRADGHILTFDGEFKKVPGLKIV